MLGAYRAPGGSIDSGIVHRTERLRDLHEAGVPVDPDELADQFLKLGAGPILKPA